MTERSFRPGRWAAAVLAATGIAVAFYQVVADNMPKGEVRSIPEYTPWSKETIAVAAKLPVQDGGRIKPLSSHAGFTMLGLHGARSMKIRGAGDKEISLKPVPWMLDLLFRPQFAIHQPTFRIDNSAVLEAVGVKTRGKRDRYSYNDILPGREKLGELAQSFVRVEEAKRDPMQNQLISLSSAVTSYESLLGHFTFARYGLVLTGSGENGGPDKRTEVSSLMEASTSPDVRAQIDKARSGAQALDPRMEELLRQVVDNANFARAGFMVLPPSESSDKTWRSAGNRMMEVVAGESGDPRTAIDDVAAMEILARSIDDGEPLFREKLGAFANRIEARAKARGEGSQVHLEAAYNKANLFLYAMVFFLIAMLVALAMWAFGRSAIGSICFWTSLAFTVTALVCCATAIVLRCVIMGRPPVGNLYDTVIFIATVVVALALLIEYLVPRRFAVGIAPILGAGLIILARRFEVGDAKDHMDPLVAVLDSNYWLTTHVITITMGYAAGLLSAFLSSAFVLMRGLNLDNNDHALRRIITRVIYGMLCFTLFLSLVGTVLGGIWANDSWGRFWGWDPKENGALLIVLWTLAILHARIGGYVREWGLHLASIFTAIVVTFSWWHVNFLGVGLHNYGFTAGKNTIWIFYAVITAALLFGFVCMMIDKSSQRQQPLENPSEN